MSKLGNVNRKVAFLAQTPYLNESIISTRGKGVSQFSIFPTILNLPNYICVFMEDLFFLPVDNLPLLVACDENPFITNVTNCCISLRFRDHI